jgi:hypothetical protein
MKPQQKNLPLFIHRLVREYFKYFFGSLKNIAKQVLFLPVEA